jgi:four helix bundle protein
VSERNFEYPTGSGDRPAYKEHPLWIEAMAMTHAAYDLADRVRPQDPATARHLRRAAVAIPAHLAGALSAEDGEERRDHVTTALISLAEVSRQLERAEKVESAAALGLAERARNLERAARFELGDAGARVC